MRAKYLALSAAAAVLIVSVTWLVQHKRERHRAAEREIYYQTALAKFTKEIAPGMTRVQVERQLQTSGTRFRQMCCVANFRNQYVSIIGAGWDDLVKIGSENVPWFCSENNVYIALEFNPKLKGELADTNGSDILKKISVFHQLEGCL